MTDIQYISVFSGIGGLEHSGAPPLLFCDRAASAGTRTGFGIVSPSGMYDGRMLWTIEHEPVPLAVNLCDFLDLALRDSLSSQAAAGLIVRSIRSGHSMHVELLDALLELAGQRGRLKPSRGDSFAALDSLRGDLNAYRAAQASRADGIRPIP